jgi:hypothetical protein
MDCPASNIGQGSAFYIGDSTSNTPIAYIDSINGTAITDIQMPFYVETSGGSQPNSGGTVGTISVDVYGCVAMGAAVTSGTHLGSATATYSGETGNTFALGGYGAGNNNPTYNIPTDFSFSSSPITIPTNCASGDAVIALKFTASTFGSYWVAANAAPISSSCFMDISSSATNVDTGNYSFMGTITATH